MSIIIGTIAPLGFEAQGSGLTEWLFCDGSAVSRTTYAALFTAIGTAWGSGDNSTTFNLPDLRGYFPRGVDDGANRDPNSGSRRAMKPGGNTGNKVGSGQSWGTGLPASGQLTTSTDGAHSHPIQHLPNDNSYYNIAGSHYASWNSGTTTTTTDGNHNHVCGQGNNNGSGGDSESRPVNVYVDYIVYTGPAPASASASQTKTSKK